MKSLLVRGRSPSQFALAALLICLSVVGVSSAHADAIAFDSTDILANVAAAVTFITTVGLAVLGMLFVAKGIKWARKAG